MKATVGCLLCWVVCLHSPAYAQKIDAEKAVVIDALLDSAEMYELRDPVRSFQFASTVVNNTPEQENEFICVRALLYCANSEKIRGNVESAFRYCDRAIEIAHRVNHPELLVRSYFLKGTVFGLIDDEDSTLVYFQKVIEYYVPPFDPYFVSQAHTSIASIYASIGNEERAEEYYLEGYRLASSSEYARVFALSELIGFYASRNNPKYLPYLDTLSMSDFYQKASQASILAHFDSFLRLDDSDDKEKEARLREVLEYARTKGNATNQVGYGLKLYSFLTEKGRYNEGHDLLLELLPKAISSQSGRRISDMLMALYENSKNRGDLDEALRYLERHGQVRDSLLSAENRNIISELNVKFETAQKDLEIAQQKADIAQAHRNRNFFIALTGLLGALAALTFFFFRNKARTARRITAQEKVIHEQERERLLREKELAQLTASLETQERERNRIARDLHDGLGSLMSGISAQIETLRAQPSVEATGSPYLVQLRDMVKEATAELRRTSYELMPASLLRQGLEPAIRDLCLNLLVKNSIEPVLEINADLSLLSPEHQLTIYRVVQELLNNIVKHSGATDVLLQFNHFEDDFSIVVEDNGKGFDVSEKTQAGGLGLGSLQTRVDLLKGSLDIASLPGEGTTATINFPYADRA